MQLILSNINCTRRALLKRGAGMVGLVGVASIGGWPAWLAGLGLAECPTSHTSRAVGASGNRFDRPSMAVELDAPHFAFDIGYLQGPAYYDIPYLRVYVHETLHFWQMLSVGFVTNLGIQEWDDLLEFEPSGKVPKDADLKLLLREQHSELGFSAMDLIEALARYWDIHILGPVKLQEWSSVKRSYEGPISTQRVRDPSETPRPYFAGEFDALMKAEDTYAEPYRLALARWGSQKSVVLFPLVGYCALQTKRPVRVFTSAIAQLEKDITLPVRFSIHDEWRRNFPIVYKRCNEIALSETGAVLTPGWDVLSRSKLIDQHPVMQHHKALLNGAMGLWGRSEMELYFAIPGDPEARGHLIAAFLPPVTLFRNGCWAVNSQLTELALKTGNPRILDATRLAAAATTINWRYRQMRKARMLGALGLAWKQRRLATDNAARVMGVSERKRNHGVEFRWAVQSFDADDLRSKLAASGADVRPETEKFVAKGDEMDVREGSEFAPLVYVVGAIAVVQLADFVLKFAKDVRHSGLVIDATGEKLDVREEPTLDRGDLVVLGVDKDKVVRLQPKDRDELVKLLERVVRLMKK